MSKTRMHGSRHKDRGIPQVEPLEDQELWHILREKKQSEIMQILGQSTGNITSQRTYIHRELGADSLRQPIPLSAGVDEARGRA